MRGPNGGCWAGLRCTRTALSEYVRRQVLADYSVAPQRVHVIFNGIEVAGLEEPERAAHRAQSARNWE